MIITAANLRSLAPNLDIPTATAYSAAITDALPAGNIDSNLRLRHFMAQIATETNGFRALVENLHYTNPLHLHETFPGEIPSKVEAAFLIMKGAQAIANRIYANRDGNGNEQSDDGWKYRGRGFIQLTFRSNYREVGDEIGMDLLTEPELLEQPGPAAKAAAKFWDHVGCNVYADMDNIVGVTRHINPALEGLDTRKTWLTKCAVFWPGH